MICEPNFYLPQVIDLKSMKKSNETTKDIENELESANFKTKVSYEQKEYNMLPLFQDEFVHLNDVLSLHTNDYLACRWNSFLDNVPKSFIRIRLYMDHKKSLEPRVVRRKLLNGNFFGIDNKLAPVPQMSDPRRSTKKAKKKVTVNRNQ